VIVWPTANVARTQKCRHVRNWFCVFFFFFFWFLLPGATRSLKRIWLGGRVARLSARKRLVDICKQEHRWGTGKILELRERPSKPYFHLQMKPTRASEPRNGSQGRVFGCGLKRFHSTWGRKHPSHSQRRCRSVKLESSTGEKQVLLARSAAHRIFCNRGGENWREPYSTSKLRPYGRRNGPMARPRAQSSPAAWDIAKRGKTGSSRRLRPRASREIDHFLTGSCIEAPAPISLAGTTMAPRYRRASTPLFYASANSENQSPSDL